MNVYTFYCSTRNTSIFLWKFDSSYICIICLKKRFLLKSHVRNWKNSLQTNAKIEKGTEQDYLFITLDLQFSDAGQVVYYKYTLFSCLQ
jgi:hypothetical protein